MTREGIIQELLASGEVKTTVDYWMRGASWELRKEMMQEVWLWLCTYDEAKLMDAYDNGLINALVTAFIRNQWRTRKSVFLYKFCRYKAVGDDELFNYIKGSEEQKVPEDDDRLWLIKQTLESLPEKEKKVWDTYLKVGEYKETAEVLGYTNWWQVKTVINRVRRKVEKVLKWQGMQ